MTAPKPAAAGTPQSLTIADSAHRLSTVTVQAVDDVGNGGIPCQVWVDTGKVRCGMAASG